MASYTSTSSQFAVGKVAAANQDDEPCMHALKLLGGLAVPFTIKAVIELGIMDLLLAADRAMTAEALTAALPCPAPAPAAAAAMVDRMLRFLASHGVVRCATESEELGSDDGKSCRRYAAAPVCKWFARGGGVESVVPMGFWMTSTTNMETWHNIKDGVLAGETPFDKAYGMPVFEYLGANGTMNTLFNEAMASHSMIITKRLLEVFRGFENYSVLVDVGGGNGTTMQMIRSQYENISGINYDLPHVIAQASPIEGVEHVAGNMFDNIPRGDAIILKWILHNWGDKECVKILKNCYTALPVNGTVIILEYILPETPEETLASQLAFDFDLGMMLFFGASGKERTEKELLELAREAGFSGDYTATYIFANVWAHEFTK